MTARDSRAEGPKIYVITVQGRLDPSWSEWFSGMTIAAEESGEGRTVTTLTGPVVDQAALHGLLARISDLNLTLLSVAQVP